MNNVPSFSVDRVTFLAIVKVCERYEAIAKDLGLPLREHRMARMMDLAACHANGSPVDFDALLTANDSDFVHDVAGITRHIDRETGKLGDGFSPRYAKRERTTPVGPYAAQEQHEDEQRALHEDRHAS